ncbi:phosphoglycerate mutase [Aureimonas endophytica]|uniref:Phosphoglycerate mutase n=1 Tax=Aureimonas endophytica TaxID=2027858 RepID=A0A917A421_9HYPH|nr:histidine phosphatase family protein [Aureimonas endophytica]GGE24039.1 phosphoglycerate mutase [Aureimonas endophytica]
MRSLFFITHPEVVVDAGRPVPRWHLSDRGIARMRAFAAGPDLAGIRAIWASDETKAIEAAGILAGALGLPIAVDPDLRENDRSATGFLPPPEFEAMADAFFAEPSRSVRGWERAIDAQARVRRGFDRILTGSGGGDIAIVAHGGVGTLLLCQLLGEPISRRRDQPFQGHYWRFDIDAETIGHPWRPIAER